MQAVMVLNSGANLNGVLIPGPHALSASGTYTNLPTEVTGKSATLDVKYLSNNARQIMQTLTYRNGNQPKILMRYIDSDSANPYPSGTFSYGVWYSISTTAI